MAKPENRDELLAQYAGENEPMHGLNSLENEDAQAKKLAQAVDKAMFEGPDYFPEDRLRQSMADEVARGGLMSNPEVGAPLVGLAATAGGGIAASQQTVSGTPAATPNTYTDLDGDTWRKVGNNWKLERAGPGDSYTNRMSNNEMRGFMAQELEHARQMEARGERFSGAWSSADAARNEALRAQQRRLGGFGSADQTEAARLAKQAKGEALRSSGPAQPLHRYRQPGSGITAAGPLVRPNEERPLWQQREKHMREYRRLQSLPPDHPDRTSYRDVRPDRWPAGRRVTKMQDVVTKIQAIEAEIARNRNIGTLSRGPEGGRALGLGTGRTDFGHVGHYPSGTQDEFWRARNVAAGDADVAFRQDIERKLNEMRRYFNQAAIARELSKVSRVPAMAGQVSKAIPGAQALALIAEPLMLFASKFDDPSEGTFGISFGTQLKAMASTLTRSTGKPTPLQSRHLEPEAIDRLRAEPETAQDLYNFGAISEELWQDVKPRPKAPVRGG